MPKKPTKKSDKVYIDYIHDRVLEGLNVKFQIQEPLGDLPAGTWLFATLYFSDKGQLLKIRFDGSSTPPESQRLPT